MKQKNKQNKKDFKKIKKLIKKIPEKKAEVFFESGFKSNGEFFSKISVVYMPPKGLSKMAFFGTKPNRDKDERSLRECINFLKALESLDEEICIF